MIETSIAEPQIVHTWTHQLCTKAVQEFSSVQLLSRVRLFATPWTTARQASLSIISSRSLLKFISIEWMMPSNHLILCHPLLLPSIFPSISLFQWASSLHHVAKVLELQHQFTRSCPTLCSPMNHSTLGLPVHHQLPESIQTYIHWVGDTVQLSYPLSSPSALNLS